MSALTSDSSMHPVIHTLHDLGLAIWTGGSLMGAVGLNGAAATLTDPAERARVSTRGWSRWAPVSAAGIAAHVVGATGLLVTDLPRVRSQKGVATSSAIKTVATSAALGVAAWSAALNRKMAAAGAVPVAGATEPSAGTPADVAAVQRQLKAVQWLNPALGFGLIALTAWHEEQQRAAQQLKGRLQGLPGSLSGSRSGAALGLAALAGVGVLAARRRAAATAPGDDLVEVQLVEVDVIDLDGAASRAADGTTTHAPSPSGI